MIKNLTIGLILAFLYGCGSSGKEEQSASSEPSTSKLPYAFEKREKGVSISEDIKAKIAGKRRSKLSNLNTDGPSWFNFQINQPFTELAIAFSGQEFTWTRGIANNNDTDGTSRKLTLESAEGSDKSINVDILLQNDRARVIFNDGEESFVFIVNSQHINTYIEVYLDGITYDPPAILYDIGI